MRRLNRRRVLTVLSLLWFAAVAYLVPHAPLKVLNLLLALTAVPMVWLIWAFCRASAHQHANREARAIRTVKGERPAPLPHQQREAVR